MGARLYNVWRAASTRWMGLREGRLSRRRKVCVGIVIGVVLGLGVLAALAPRIAASALERRARAALDERAIEASWSDLSVTWQGELSLTDVSIRDPRGLGIKAARIALRPRLKSIWEGEPTIRAVEIEDATLVAEAEAIKGLMAGDTLEAPREPSRSRALIAGIMEEPPSVRLVRTTARIERDGVGLAIAEIERADIEPEDGERLRLDARGSFSTEWTAVPSILRSGTSWETKGAISLDDRTFDLAISSGQPDAALVSTGLPRIGRVRVESMRLVRETGEGVTVGARGIEVVAGDALSPIASLKASSIVWLGPARARSFAIEAPHFQVDPTRISEIGELPARLRAGSLTSLIKGGKKERAQGAGGLGAVDVLATIERAGGAFSSLIARYDASITDGRLGVFFSPQDDGGSTKRIELVRDLNGQIEGGAVTMSGTASGGSFEARASFVPGAPLPTVATLRAVDVAIDTLPGMSSRTLPNRGVRGRLGGVVDLAASWMAPGMSADWRSRMLESASLRTSFVWRDGELMLHGLSHEPLKDLEITASHTLHWRPGQNEITIEDGELHTNGVTAQYGASLTGWPIEPLLEAEVAMPETPCQAMLDALPRALLGPYEKVRVEGEAAPALRLRYPLHGPQHLTLELDGMSAQDTPEWRRKHWRLVRRARAQGTSIMPAVGKDWRCRVEGLHADRKGWPDVTIAANPGSARQARAKTQPPSWRHPGALGDVYWLNRPFIKRVTEGVSEDAGGARGPGAGDVRAALGAAAVGGGRGVPERGDPVLHQPAASAWG